MTIPTPWQTWSFTDSQFCCCAPANTAPRPGGGETRPRGGRGRRAGNEVPGLALAHGPQIHGCDLFTGGEFQRWFVILHLPSYLSRMTMEYLLINGATESKPLERWAQCVLTSKVFLNLLYRLCGISNELFSMMNNLKLRVVCYC